MQNESMEQYFALFSNYPDISAADEKALEQWFIENGHGDIWKQISKTDRLLGDMRSVAALEQRKQEYWNYLLEQKIGRPAGAITSKKGIIVWFRYIAAASILLLLVGIGLWFLIKRQQPVYKVQIPKVEKAIVPGSYKARLTLADGRVVILDSAALGILATQGQTGIINKEGQLVYERKKGKGTQEVLYNTLTTGRGESYSVVLADGTKVWLNAASSIHYPLNFPGSKRMVEVEGEAYFEVAKNSHQPFIVQVNGLQIKVTGTVFNVNAYPEEKAVSTTLLEGQVQVSHQARTEVLAPGEQADLLPSGSLRVRKATNIDKVVGWKKGLFVLDSDHVETMMNQLARWYDVRVVYKGEIHETFTGVINRNLPVNVVLDMLEKTTVHFKIEGRTITVTP